jgi:dienelactone hydrolase
MLCWSKSRWALRFFCAVAFVTLLVHAQEPAKPVRPIGNEGFSVLAQLFDYDRDDLDTRIISSVETDGWKREKFTFTGWHQRRIPGLLVIPKGNSARYPLVMLLHGFNGSKSDWFEPMNPDEPNVVPGARLLSAALVTAGFAVLALDLEYHGERAGEADYVSPPALIRDRPNAASDMVVHSTIDYRRVLEYVERRVDLDEDRVGALGFSLGGHMTFILAAVESRVRVAVAWGTPGILGPLPPLMSVFNFAPRVKNQPFLILQGRSDPFVTAEQGRELFRALPSATKDFLFYEGEHQLRTEDVPVAVAWLQRHLK